MVGLTGGDKYFAGHYRGSYSRNQTRGDSDLIKLN